MSLGAVKSVWPEAAGTVSCLVYGLGSCGEDRPFFRHYAKRVAIRDFLRAIGVEANFPEELLDGSEPDTLWSELGLARERDFVVAIQPPEPERGPPTLKLEIADLFWQDDLRCRTWVFYPLDRPTAIFTQYAERFDTRAIGLLPERYELCEDMRDRLLEVVRVIRTEKRAWRWPPVCDEPQPRGHPPAAAR